jgi:hypothetical protein
MFIGVIAEPDENQQFDGKILIERVSNERELTRTTSRNKFHHDRHINDALKPGEWKELYPDNPTILTSEFIRLIADSYDLNEEMEDKLCLQYVTYIRGVKQTITLGENEFLLTKEITEHNGTVR